MLGDSGFELDFGLKSFTDYQGSAPTDRTQLDIAAQKKLFNDRLTVRVGSAVDIDRSQTIKFIRRYFPQWGWIIHDRGIVE